MTALTLEERVSRLEKEMELVKQSTASASWIGTMTGSFKDDPDFQEILRLGREIRQADGAESTNGQSS